VTLTDKAVVTDALQALETAARRARLFEAAPVTPTPIKDRDDLILELAEDLLALKVADAEWVRREFGRRFGRGELGPQSAEDVDTSHAHEGVVRVTYTLTSVRDWDRLRAAGFLAGDHLAGLRGVFRDRGVQRNRWREPETIVRAMAVHYLSRAGGGERSAEAAAELYAARHEADADKWDPQRHSRIIRQVEAEYGPLP
jgi:hypothetical protein